MAVDVSQRKAFFDDGLGWSFPSITYVHVIVKQLHSMFPECDNFSLNHWCPVEAFKRFGMPRQPTNGVGVILSARDFMMRVPYLWTFSEMAVHRKEVMKLLPSWLDVRFWTTSACQGYVSSCWLLKFVCVSFSWVIAAYTIFHMRHCILTPDVFTRIITRVLQHSVTEQWKADMSWQSLFHAI